jgi:hypothetical protein
VTAFCTHIFPKEHLMVRKRNGDVSPEANGTAVADPPPTAEQSATPQLQPEANGQDKPEKKRPAASFSAMSDRTTRIELSVWARQVKVSDTEEYTQFWLTFSRSWCETDGVWHANASYRTHDVPVLVFLVQQAYQWCVSQRMLTHIQAGDALPF